MTITTTMMLELGPLALDLLAASRVVDLRDMADEIATLMRAAQRPIPVLPTDPVQREATLSILLLLARDRERRLLALIGAEG